MTRKKESGQALLIAAAALGIVLMGFAGLGVDMGYLRYQKRLQQTAADSAALAGAAELLYGGNYTTAAQHDAAANGFSSGGANCPNGVGCVTVKANSPPTAGPHSGATGYVEVLVAQVQPTFFMRILGIKSETVTARAVATDTGNSSGCFYTLGTSGTDITMSGATISAPSCGIVDDSGLVISGGTITAGSVGVAGTVTKSGGTISPPPITGITQASDPLAYLTPPPVGSPCIANPDVSGSTKTLNQGTYCGLTVSGGTVNLNSGVYVFTGSVNVSGGTINGTGVMFYQTAGSVNLSGGTFNLTAPTTSNAATGAAAGIVYWQAASDTNGANISGGSMEGALYFPSSSLTISGGTATPYQIVVAKTVTISGGTVTLNANYSSLPGGSPIKDALLVE